ncbi:MAG: phosphate signaling complex protein PhoU [Succinatimonas sp.]|nr:phosphate signaling complex protein PhoU [Succinatimonas sp.]
MRKKLDEQFDELNKQFILLGSVCEKNLGEDFAALQNRDRERALYVFNQKYDLANRSRDIERLCLSLILREQPVASDLRLVSAVLKMVTDLDRIGAQGIDIAEIVTTYDYTLVGPSFDLLIKMAESVRQIMHKAIDSFVRLDLHVAEDVLKSDDGIDKYFMMVKQSIIEEMSNTPDHRVSLDVLLMAKYLERTADHCCNIAQWVLYVITGKQPGVSA